jgi:hypothetical protein
MGHPQLRQRRASTRGSVDGVASPARTRWSPPTQLRRGDCCARRHITSCASLAMVEARFCTGPRERSSRDAATEIGGVTPELRTSRPRYYSHPRHSGGIRDPAKRGSPSHSARTRPCPRASPEEVHNVAHPRVRRRLVPAPVASAGAFRRLVAIARAAAPSCADCLKTPVHKVTIRPSRPREGQRPTAQVHKSPNSARPARIVTLCTRSGRPRADEGNARGFGARPPHPSRR